MPRLGEPVPAFEAMTTKGKISFPDDYKGKWVILFSHPADFTPICTTEILTFGARTEEFRALNCELVGLSVDSRNSHIAWLKTIREKIEYKGMKDVKVGFPIIDDVAMKVASLYGMIQPGESQTAAVRAVFFVDPKGVLRAMIYYPLALGRNFDEIRRVLVGLQTIDAFGIALPADWRPGDEVIVPMKGDDQEKVPEGAKCYDWFFCTKPLPKEEIGRKLGVKVSNPAPYIDEYTEKWYNCGFEESSLSDIALFCLRTDRNDFNSMNELVRQLFSSGIVSAESVEEYLKAKNAELKLFTRIQSFCGNLKNPFLFYILLHSLGTNSRS